MTNAPDTPDTIQEPRCWSDGRWTAQVIKNEDDEGWAVEMIKDGEADPALVDHAAWRDCAMRVLGRREFAAVTSDLYDADDPELVEIRPVRAAVSGAD